MAKAFIYLVCLFLVASLSKSAPILDEEAVDEDFHDPEELLDDINNADDPEDRKSENDDENYEESKRTDDDYNDGGNDEENDEDNEEDGDVKSNENDEVEVVEEQEGKENQEDEEEEEEGEEEEEEGEEGNLDDQGVHDVTNRVVEDSDGDMDLERKPDRLDKDDLEDEEEADEDGLQDMGQQISKLKKVFQEDMPREIEKLKSSSESLRHDLDSLNTKLENFLKENGIKQSDATAPTKSDSYDDDLM